jgi:threonine-phosphate decarboxylase
MTHGGDVWQVAEELGIAPSELLDFSANINPRGLPPAAARRLAHDASDPQLLSFYPDPSARPLRHALSQHLYVPPEAIAIGPGAEALLTPILRALQPQRALVPIPAFSEYRRVCQQQEIEFVPFRLEHPYQTPVDRFCQAIEAEATRDAVVFLNNPHNPTGALLDLPEVRRIRAASRMLLLDEAFIDYAPHASLVREAYSAPGFVVLRSLTKFYGCPALRVGYVVAHPDTINRISSLQPAWPVTQLAIDALSEAVADREYAETSLRENTAAREALSIALTAQGIQVFPSAANYLFLELPAAVPDLRARLLENHRILIRNCDSYEGLSPGRYIRVAVRTASDNHRLIQALSQELTFGR